MESESDMKKFMVTTAILAFAALILTGGAAVPGMGTSAYAQQQPSTGGHRASEYYKDGSKARASRQRRGGYSYSSEDTINTYGDSRTTNNGANSYRFELYTRQTPSGPFDHGYFFDSGIGLHGGDSPYLN